MCVCVCVCDSFFLLSLFVTLYIFLHLTVMHSSTFGKGWVGMSACPLVVLACESLHVCTVYIWRCEHARFCVEVFFMRYIYIFIHSFIVLVCTERAKTATVSCGASHVTTRQQCTYTTLMDIPKTCSEKLVAHLESHAT